MKTIRSLLAITAILIAATGCASSGALNPNQQVEGRVAFYARQVITQADTALSAVEIITDQRLALAANDQARQERIKTEARAVIGVFKQVGEGGQKLAAALKEVDAATSEVDRSNRIEVVKGIVTALNKLVTDGTLSVGDDSTRASVLKLFGAVSDILLQLAFVLPQPATP